MYRTRTAICSTADGRLVAETDPEARVVAYPAGARLEPHVADELGIPELEAEIAAAEAEKPPRPVSALGALQLELTKRRKSSKSKRS